MSPLRKRRTFTPRPPGHVHYFQRITNGPYSFVWRCKGCGEDKS